MAAVLQSPARPSILSIAPYVGGESALKDCVNPARLMSNEGALGASPKALAALAAAAASIPYYPQGDSRALRQALAAAHGLDAARIVCGNGSDELITLLCQAYAGSGDEVLYSEHGFLVYPIAALAAGAVPVKAPETMLTADVDALLAAVTPRTRLLFLANPNNPTGTWLDRNALTRLRRALPEQVLLVLDAAYAEFADDARYTAGHDLVEEHGNVVVLQTFSKAYAMAGLRLGWGYFPADVADILNRIRGPFNVNALAQAAGIAALTDDAHLQATRQHNTRWRLELRRQLQDKGYPTPDSQANFVLMDCGSAARAGTLYDQLCASGIFVRKTKAYGLPSHLRVSIGTEEALRRLLDALPEAT